MKNLHKDGVKECADYAFDRIRTSRNRFEVSIDDHGDLRVRAMGRTYVEPTEDSWRVGIYTRAVSLMTLEEDIRLRQAEIRAIYRRGRFSSQSSCR